MRIESWVYDILFFVFAYLILREGRKIYGKNNADIFLWGSLLWTGIIENVNTVIGGYDYFAYANYYSFGGDLINGYGGWVAWILFVPLAACLGWFLLSFPAFMVSLELLKGKNIWLKSAFAAIILVSWDVYFDPMAVVNEWWRWTMPGFYYRGVPIGNWIGWFFLLFFFGAIYERTVIELKSFPFLSFIEKKIFRIDSPDLSTLEVQKVGKIFYFRLIAFLPAFFLLCMVFSGASTELWNNRYAPYDNIFPHLSGVEKYYTPPAGVTPTQQVPDDRIGINTENHKGNTE